MNTQFQLLDYQKNIQVLHLNDLLSEFVNREILTATQIQIEKGFTNFVVDLSDVQFINSVGLNLLIILKERLRKIGGKMALANTPSRVLQLLEMTKLRPLFMLIGTVEEAVQFLAKE